MTPLRPDSSVVPAGTARADAILVGTAWFAAWCAFLIISAQLPDGFPVGRATVRLAMLGFFVSATVGVLVVRRLGDSAWTNGATAILACIATTMLFCNGFVLLGYLRLPVDLLSFSESSFVNDIIKFRTDTKIYTPLQDNSAYPYPPGTPLLTYAIASLFGRGTSIPALRLVQYGFVVLGALFATLAARRLALRVAPAARPSLLLWSAVWMPILLLVGTAPQFNAYNHTLHNDGLALCVTMCAFYVATRHLDRPSAVSWVSMAVLPAAGFLVKQSLLIWVAVFAWVLVTSGAARFRHVVLLVFVSSALSVGVVAFGYQNWGDEHFIAWLFQALGEKRVSVARSLEHLVSAGLYVALGIAGVWETLARRADRSTLALVSVLLMLVTVEAYTSGIGFAANHLGPGIMLAVVFALSVLPAVWPRTDASRSVIRALPPLAGATALVAFLLSGLGLFSRPSRPIPDDFARYTSEIEREFAGVPASRVLMDFGSWIYLRENVVMKDRSDPVALHAGSNSASINRKMLAETIARIESRSYDKILTRAIDTPESPYDFHDAGSGVKAAILRSYVIVRRIRPVEGVSHWWPMGRLAEVDVLVPRAAE